MVRFVRELSDDVRRLGYSALLFAGVPFFLVACTFTYYGQLNREPHGDTYGTVYTAVAIVKQHTIWLDDDLRYIQQRAGDQPYMLAVGSSGHVVNVAPSASSLLAVPVVAAFSVAGAQASSFDTWMDAGMLTAALTTAASAAILLLALRRLTTRRRAALITAAYAWGTLAWSIDGQALWQHAGASLGIALALFAYVDRRLVLAGLATGAMVAFRPSLPFIAILLMPLIGPRLRDILRFAVGIAPFALPLAIYNTVAFGSPIHQGYGSEHVMTVITPHVHQLLKVVPSILFAPGRGLFLYSPVLLFAVFGAIRGWRTPIYRWSSLAALVYLFINANDNYWYGAWYGGETFGARKLADMLPLLAVLLVPAVDAIVHTKWRWVFAATLTWSIFVEVLAATGWPSGTKTWFDRQSGPIPFSTWWSPTNNEIVTMLQTSGVAVRLVEMVALLVGGIALGLVTTQIQRSFRTEKRSAQEAVARP